MYGKFQIRSILQGCGCHYTLHYLINKGHVTKECGTVKGSMFSAWARFKPRRPSEQLCKGWKEVCPLPDTRLLTQGPSSIILWPSETQGNTQISWYSVWTPPPQLPGNNQVCSSPQLPGNSQVSPPKQQSRVRRQTFHVPPSPDARALGWMWDLIFNPQRRSLLVPYPYYCVLAKVIPLQHF